MIRTIVSIIIFIAVLVVLQLAAVNASGGIGGSLGLRPTTHKCIGLPVDGSTTSALPTGDWGFDYLLHVSYQVPENREGVQMCLGQDIWFGE